MLVLVRLMLLHGNQVTMFFVMNNSLRCWIIRLLKSNRTLKSTDIADLLHISLSRCHYHLDNMNGLVEQDEENHYSLSKEGMRAFQLLSQV